MRVDGGRRIVRSIIWGVFLMALGVALLLERYGSWNLPPISHLWPVILFVPGLIRLLEWRPGGALTMFALGAWFLACEFHWRGLDYGNSWPLILVAVGLGIVIRALSGEDARRLGIEKEVHLD